ncbi:hypothetical protein AAF712_016223 [Marasmius tenuissimus]|uniref:Uncharacterized protein n=1 Tax=Marasmius tenuissimus TaxID=585030 RepID=A0ABR2Z8I7_9AGAR
MEQLERRSNKRFGYPRVFLNVVEFDEEFKRRVPLLSSAYYRTMIGTHRKK